MSQIQGKHFVAHLALLPVLTLCFLLRALGLRGLKLAGHGLGSFLLACGFRREIVMGNLEMALGGEKSRAELDCLIKNIYKNIGLTFLEIARNFALPAKQMRAELEISAADRARLDEVMRSGRGAVVVSAHIANWELLAMGVAAHGYKVAVVVKKMSSAISQVLIERQRTKTGLAVIYSGNTLEKMKVALAEGKLIGFMVDQNITGKKGIRANFFNVPAASIRGLGSLVKETGVPVIPAYASRRADGRHQLHLLPALPYLKAENLPEGSEERALREEWLNAQQYQHAVEQMVRAHPEQWLWIHRRWKASRVPLVRDFEHVENRS